MLAARTLLPPQDENAGAATAVLQNKENAVAFGQARGGLGGNGKAGALAPQPTAPQASVRKALGNITNTAVKRVDGLASSSKPGAGAGGAGSKTEGRRAFGDITNSVKPQQQPGGGDTLKRRLQPIGQQPLQQAQQEPQPQHAGPSAPSLAQCASRAEQYAAEYGVERLAGKSAKEQEVERLAREEAGIEMRVRQLTSALGQWQAPGACCNHSDSEDEGDGHTALGATPSLRIPLRKPNTRQHGGSPQDDQPLLLPDSPAAPHAGFGLAARMLPSFTVMADPELDFDFDDLA